MALRFFILLCFLKLSLLGQTVADSANRVCVPGKSVGAITAHSSEKDLIRIYGKHNIMRDTIYLGEGEFEIGTVLFANTANELLITWHDSIAFAKPNWVFVTRPNSSWKTNLNIHIGSTLKEIEKINGKAFTMMGFEWDYAGTIVNWHGGKLDLYHTDIATDEGFILRLAEGNKKNLSAAEYESLIGEKEFLSNLPSLQKLNPTVYELILFFRD